MNAYIKEFDRQFTALANALPKSWAGFMQALTFLGEPVVVITAGFAGLLATSLRGPVGARQAFIYSLLAFFIGTATKRLIHRDRPNHLKVESFGLTSYSFPSGHAYGSMIIFGMYGIIDIRHLLFPWNLLAVLVIGAIIFMIGVSRVYLKSHYPSDVVGGWIFGALALVVITRLAF